MKNVVVKVDMKAKTATFTVKLDESFGPSGSGKTLIVASSEGNAAVEGVEGMRFGLNVYKTNPEYKPAPKA